MSSHTTLLCLNLVKLSCISMLHSNYRFSKHGLFFAAIEYNRIDVVKYLIKNIDINLPNTMIFKGREYYYTPLMIASKFNRCEIIEILLDNGALINYQMPRWLYTALHIAVTNNHVTAVTILLSRGASTNLKNIDGYTALHKAVIYRRRIEIIKLLLKYNADVGIRDNNTYRISSEGCTPFDIVNKYYNHNTIELLTSHIVRLDKSNSAIKNSDGFKHNKELIEKNKTLRDIEKKCISDMNKMKKIIINKRVTLFDSFVNNDVDLITHCKDRYEIRSLTDNLTIYRDLYSDFINTCILRSNLMKRTISVMDNLYSKYFSNITSWNDLPYEIKYNILKYMNNDELLKVSGANLL
ncbi:SWPV2-ORF046 [Shearwaterpox virus]|uniref:SWPV2-ORF046 n=1 Tax=Shearwaterpox virus TaxID=1974596 RepID=A0A1V0QG14_CNPV|nr:SWPV2-ORF046 [Shearwaterpox virus]QRM15680.1 ankyrin repeat protein [Penguinpox virus 2]QRM16010.1 ankyrin repeat protein [Albatrosspox virus]